jgi:hypothetical protein
VKHYAIEKWTDFIRGLIQSDEHNAMELHLTTGCTRCNAIVSMLRAVNESRDDLEVPDALLDRARAIFPRSPAWTQTTTAPASPWQRLVAALTFDSHSGELSPALAGLRSVPATGSVRRLAYGVDDLVIELLVDTGATHQTVSLTGQISSSAAPPGPQGPHHVRLLAKSTVLDQTLASAFGEFHLEFPRRSGLRLLIADKATGREIEVPLDLVLSPRSVSWRPGPKP